METVDLFEGYITEDELAKQLGKAPRTIKRWGVSRTGPPQTKVGRTVMYKVESFRQWLADREKKQTRAKRP